MKFKGVLWLFVLSLGIHPGSAQSAGSGAVEGSGPDLLSNPAPEVVLQGMDPIFLIQGEERPGSPDRARIYRGFEYRFASRENLDRFAADPDRYAVADDGYCPVARARLGRDVAGDPSVFSVYRGRIYLFGNGDARRVFLQDPESFLKSRPLPGDDATEGSGPERKEGSGM